MGSHSSPRLGICISKSLVNDPPDTLNSTRLERFLSSKGFCGFMYSTALIVSTLFDPNSRSLKISPDASNEDALRDTGVRRHWIYPLTLLARISFGRTEEK